MTDSDFGCTCEPGSPGICSNCHELFMISSAAWAEDDLDETPLEEYLDWLSEPFDWEVLDDDEDEKD